MTRPTSPDPAPGLTGLPAPPGPGSALAPARLEATVRAAMHTDRTPGVVLAVCHPLRMDKAPHDLLDELRARGFRVEVVETRPDRVASVRALREALLAGAGSGRPLDVLVFSGDGSLDHHVLVAAYWAFYPDLVRERTGSIRVTPPTPEELALASPSVRRALLDPLPDGAGLEPDEATIHRIWVLRARMGAAIRGGSHLDRVLRAARVDPHDPLLRISALAALVPHRVALRPHGFDLSALAQATQEQTFQGLYPYIRSIAPYPVGTAADNALYCGVPGYFYAQVARPLARFGFLAGLRGWLEARATRRFLDYFCRAAVVVPARLSVIGFDDDWQSLCSHAAGGPAGGWFFAADLEEKTGGLSGYLARIPAMLWRYTFVEKNVLKVEARTASGEVKAASESRLVESLYTNRAFIAGVGSVPSANPTAFAGQSSLVMGAPPVYRGADGALTLDLGGLLAFGEAIAKGVIGRLAHLIGLGVGQLAGGGRFAFAPPENQLTLTDGELVRLEFYDLERKPLFVPTQVSGDPYQATSMDIRVAWGPIPLLASVDSLLLAAAQRALGRLREEQTWNLATIHIGGLPWFRHQVGPSWSPAWREQTGLVMPPRTLPLRLDRAQEAMIRRWEGLGAGRFVDTTEQGLAPGRTGRYAHNGEQTAHLVVLRETRSTLLVRQVRRQPGSARIYEARALYRRGWGGWIIHESQTRMSEPGEPPRILQEEHYFRSADAFRQDAAGFFPFLS